MKLKTVLTVALAALLIAPAASAGVTDLTDSPPAVDETTVESPDSTAPPGDEAGAEDDSHSDSADESSNYTRLYIEDGYRHADVKPGGSVTFNVTVGNSEDHAVTLNPHLVLPKINGRPIEQSWATIEDANTTLAPGEERTFSVTVEVPEGTDLGDYSAQIAFTNQTVSYNQEPERPVHAAHLSVDVYKDPTVKITGDRYNWAQVKAGDSYTFEYVIENTGNETVPLNPEFSSNRRNRYRYGSDESSVERSWFTVEAPNEIAPGENATVTITVTPPEDADVGDYDAEFDLGLKDPARPDRRDYWQQVRLHFQVWQQPDEPFETNFQVKNGTESVDLTLSAGEHSKSDMPVSFNVTFVAPNGTVVEHQRVQSKKAGHVRLGESSPTDDQQGPYSSNGAQKQYTYRVEEPAAGNWTVKIMPRNTMNFRYEIVNNETG